MPTAVPTPGHDLASLLVAAALSLALAAPAAAAIGDCVVPGQVRVNDLITAVNIALGVTPLEACRSLDADGDGVATVDELLRAVLYALGALPEYDPHCGDNVVDRDEDCDDGNLHDGDACSSSCQFEGVGVLDQWWSGYRGCGGSYGGGNIGLLGPLAQEFVPQLNAVTSVLVDVESARVEPGTSLLRLNIREATFDGPLLGWATAHVPHSAPSEEQQWVRFDLPVPVAVTPGRVYVFEVVGYDDGLALVSSAGDPGCDEREYLPGDPVPHGERVEGNDTLFAVFGTDAPGVGAVDQAWDDPQGLCGEIDRVASLGAHTLAQTFTPAVDALGAVAVKLSAVAGTAVPAATLTLKLRESSPTGTVLASVARYLAAPTGGDAWYVFPLSPPLAVTPGALYAIELSDGVPRFEWIASMGDAAPQCSAPQLVGGEAFADGVPLGSDFPFATFAP